VAISGFSTMNNYQLAVTGQVEFVDKDGKKKKVVVTGTSKVFTTYTYMDKNKALFTVGQQVAEDDTNSISGMMNNQSVFIPGVSAFALMVLLIGWFVRKMYCQKKTKEELMAEAAMKKKAGIEDPFNHGLNSMLSDVICSTHFPSRSIENVRGLWTTVSPCLTENTRSPNLTTMGCG
jgi:hypothetical protein